MKNILGLMAFLATVSASTVASAGLLVEPYLGYETSATAGNVTVSGTSVDAGGKITGSELGLRLGYKLPVMVWLALDYSMMSGGKYSGATGFDGKVDRSNLYFDVGVDLPILFRVYAGMGLGVTEKYKPDSGAADNTYKGGSSYKLGASFTGLPFVCINLDYFVNNFATVDSGGTSTNINSFVTGFKDTGMVLNVSLPLNL